MDPGGSLLIMAAIVCLLLALQWGGVTKAWNAGEVIATLVLFVALTVAFVVFEYFQGDRAILVPHIMKKRVVYVGCITSFL